MSLNSTKLEKNILQIKELFCKDDTIRIKKIQNAIHPEIKCAAIYVDGMVSNTIVNQSICEPIIRFYSEPTGNMVDFVNEQILYVNSSIKTKELPEMISGVLSGDTLLLIDGHKTALVLNTKGWMMRGVSEPTGEVISLGPREGFIEAMLFNCSFIRRKIQTPNLKFQFLNIGHNIKNKVCVAYIEGIAKPELVERVISKLKDYPLNSSIDSNYINETIRDHKYSIFKTLGKTERPDIVAAKLYEGRVAIIVDGTPVVLTAPYLFLENFQRNEEYYTNFYYAAFSRILTFLAYLLASCMIGVFVALITHHPHLLPDPIAINVAISRETMPFPIFLEAFFLMLIFDILKETSTRTSSGLSSTLGIVGALILGNAAVEAKFISAPMVIIIAFSGTATLLARNLKVAVMTFQYLNLIVGALFGLYGIAAVFVLSLVYLICMKSFETPYMSGFFSLKPQIIKDTFIRAPWNKMRTVPSFLTNATHRMSSKKEARENEKD